MKKLVMALVMTAAMAMASVCAAAGEGALLTKEQKLAETFFAGLNGEPAVTYVQASAGFNAELKKNVTEAKYTQLQKDIKEKMGKVTDLKLVVFQRGQNADLVRYIGKSVKLGDVVLNFIFDATGKVADFGVAPIPKQAPQQGQQPAKAPAAPAK